MRSLRVAEKVGDKLRILTAITNIGAVYSHNDSTLDEALSYNMKALPLAEELGDKEAIGTIYGNIGSIYVSTKKDSLALIYLKKSLGVFGNSGNSVDSYNEIGKVYLKQKKYKLALQNHQKAYAIAKKLDGKLDIVRSLQGLGRAYAKLGDKVAAISYYKEAESIAKGIDALFELKNGYKDMADSYDSMGDYRNAYLCRGLFLKYYDTLYNKDIDIKLAGLQFDFDLQKNKEK